MRVYKKKLEYLETYEDASFTIAKSTTLAVPRSYLLNPESCQYITTATLVAFAVSSFFSS